MSWPSVPGTKYRRYRLRCRALVYQDSLMDAGLFPWRRACGLVSWPPKAYDGITLTTPLGTVRIVAHPLAVEGTLLVVSTHTTTVHAIASLAAESSTGIHEALQAEAVGGRRPQTVIVSPLTWAGLNTEMAHFRRYDASW